MTERDGDGRAGSSATAGGGGGSAGTFTAVAGSGGAAAGTGGSGGSAGSSGSGGSAGSTAGAGGDCAGAAGGACGDQCPDDPDKTEPGACGCGVPDVDTALVAGCQGLKNALVHRYTFDGTDDVITDSIGTAHGAVIGGTVSGNGLLTLSGGSYGELPGGIVSALTNATFEAWVNWTANNGQAWQRIFDFGVSDGGAGMQGIGQSYLFLSVDIFRFCYQATPEAGETRADGQVDFPSPATTHVVSVFDDANNQMKLYLNGALQDTASVTGSLSSIDDANNWLGRSQYADPAFGGNLREFRIYDAALSDAQIQRSYELGEEPAFLAE